MATDALAGLFGSPLSQAQLQNQLIEQRAAQIADMNLGQMGAFLGYKGGAQLGQGVAGLFGQDVTDPMVRKATQLRQLAQGIDVTTTAGLDEYAKRLQANGFTEEAARLSQQIVARSAQEAEARTKAMKATREEANLDREEKLQAELQALPEGASEADMLNLVRKYGKPDAVLAALERSNLKKAELEAKATLEKEKQQARELEKQRDREFKMQMAQLTASLRQSNNDVQRQLIQARIDALNDKKQDKADKQINAAESAAANADRVIAKVDEALPLVSGMTTGLGSITSFIPGTSGADLRSTLETIKANLGFDRLQQMRDASPTGGALGQVAVQELVALQSSVASLDMKQSPETLKKNLDQIKYHYGRWREAVLGKIPEDKRPTAGASAPPAAGQPTPSKAPAAQGQTVDFNSLKP